MILQHVTSAQNAKSILENGFNPDSKQYIVRDLNAIQIRSLT
jgi:RNA:NAD 2'-phosphotransferase (TPT1/KptA family)